MCTFLSVFVEHILLSHLFTTAPALRPLNVEKGSFITTAQLFHSETSHRSCGTVWSETLTLHCCVSAASQRFQDYPDIYPAGRLTSVFVSSGNGEVVAGTGEQCPPFDEARCGDGRKATEAQLLGPKGQETERLRETVLPNMCPPFFTVYKPDPREATIQKIRDCVQSSWWLNKRSDIRGDELICFGGGSPSLPQDTLGAKLKNEKKDSRTATHYSCVVSGLLCLSFALFLLLLLYPTAAGVSTRPGLHSLPAFAPFNGNFVLLWASVIHRETLLLGTDTVSIKLNSIVKTCAN